MLDDRPATRAVALLALGLALGGLCVWYGTLEPAPSVHDYPDDDALAAHYAGHLGERVTLSGVVVDTEPVTIAVAMVSRRGVLRGGVR